jgi:Na+/H+ antiporter NhaD/arsenite permease-like protein
MSKLFTFIKKEIVLCIAMVLALGSCFVVRPSAKYGEYIDFRVLAILLSLMLVVAILQNIGMFEKAIRMITLRIHTVRLLRTALVLVCFFSSMVITNDVALITFVPFTIMLMERLGQRKEIIYLVVLETVAANLGSMMTPIGNPQNVYIFSTYEMGLLEFVITMLPYGVVSLVLLFVAAFVPKGDKCTPVEMEKITQYIPWWRYVILIVMFVVSIACVLRFVDYRIMLVITIIGVVLWDYKLLIKADYMLLLTFVAFLIFVGNVKQIPEVNQFVEKLMEDNVALASIGISQVISNVPAAVLLSGFTEDGRALLCGVNIGGLGTLIASMASLISYKAYASMSFSKKIKYLLVFTVVNIVFLLVMLLIMWIIGVQI